MVIHELTTLPLWSVLNLFTSRAVSRLDQTSIDCRSDRRALLLSQIIAYEDYLNVLTHRVEKSVEEGHVKLKNLIHQLFSECGITIKVEGKFWQGPKIP